VGHDAERLEQIPGSMPRLTDIPRGCAFNPRCPQAHERCFRDRPEPLPVEDSRVACWLYDEANALSYEEAKRAVAAKEHVSEAQLEEQAHV
jgi:peptide/nickel transport system ATP-binding protein